MRAFILVLLLCCPLIGVSEPVSLDYQTKFFRDQDSHFDSSSILLVEFEDMPYSESFGLENGNYWFKVSIQKRIDNPKRLILQIPAHNIDNVAIYKRVKDELICLTESEIDIAQIHSRFPTFSFDTNNESNIEYYIRADFEKEANFPLRIYAADEYYEFAYKHHTFTGAYYGFLFAIIICNIFFYIRFNDKVYLYYVIFLFSYTIAILYRDGSMNLILPNTLFIDLESVSHLCTQITMFLFAFVFLDFKRYVPSFKKYATGLVMLMTLLELTYAFTGNFLFYAVADVVAMVSFFITWILCVIFMRKIKYTRFYILGYSILLVFGFHFLFSHDFGIIPNNGRTVYLKIASTVDMLIFTYAISYRLDVLNKEYKTIIRELRALLSKVAQETDSSTFYSLLEENSISNKPLTVQEIKVVKCIHQGLTNRETAEKLFVSSNTIKFHVRNIYKKLDVKSRQEANAKLEGLQNTNA